MRKWKKRQRHTEFFVVVLKIGRKAWVTSHCDTGIKKSLSKVTAEVNSIPGVTIVVPPGLPHGLSKTMDGWIVNRPVYWIRNILGNITLQYI